jgi:hypothetical protein
MALTAMHITRDPTGAIDIGLTDTGATIEKVPSGSPILPFNCSFQNEIVSQASPLSLAGRLQHYFNAPIFLIAKGLVGGWCFLEWKAMSDDE